MRDESSLSRTEAACMAGVGRGWNGIDELRALSANDTERWYTVEQFERDHVVEILEKLEQGSLDDEIWGKIILMEKCRRLAKAYLRRTTVIIDGSSDEYDGITLGFNHFENCDNNDIRHKIGDVDENGNIKAMARGLAPVIVQGWNEPTSKCISRQLIAQKGHLKTIKDRLKGITDQQRIEKIFDMRLFNLAIEQELNEPEPNTPELLLKTCIRVSLVKDAATNALKTPCWFMIINLVALDVLRTKLPVLRPVSGTFCPSSRNDNIIFSAPATTQSTATLNEIFPSSKKQLMYSSGRRSESLSVLDQIRQLLEFASTLQTSQNSIPIRRQRSLSCSDSEDIPAPLRKAIHNKKKRSPSKNLSLSSKSSSGFSSMDFVKNFEKVENWCKNSSEFLEQKKGEILADEETDDTTSSEHELIKSAEPWSIGMSPPFTQRKLLSSDDQSVNKKSDNNKATDFSDSQTCQSGHCIRISSYDEQVEDELKQKSADNKSRTQHCCSISTTEENMVPVEVAQCPCKTEPQGSQLLNRKCRTEESKIVPRNISHANSCLTMKDNIYSDKDPKCLGRLTVKEKVAMRKNPKLVTDDRCFMYPKNDSSRLQMNYLDSSYNAKRYANKQHVDMTRIPVTRDCGSRNQSDLFSELPEVDYPVETIYHSDHENMKKRADTSDMNYPEHHYSRTAEEWHKVTCGTSRHPCLPETNNAKKNYLKNLFIPSKKLLRNVGSNCSSQQNFGKPSDMQQSSRYLKIHGSIPEEVRSGARCQPSQVEPVVHRILIMSKKEKEAMTLPQKKMTTRKSGLAESIHTSHFVVNPVYANGVTGSNRIRQPEIMIPRCETPHNVSRDNRRNINVSIPCERATLIASYPSHSLSSSQPRKAFRRFI